MLGLLIAAVTPLVVMACLLGLERVEELLPCRDTTTDTTTDTPEQDEEWADPLTSRAAATDRRR